MNYQRDSIYNLWESFNDVAEGFGIGFVVESEIGNDIRLNRIRLESVSLSMPETLAHLSARGDVPVIRSFMRTLAEPDDRERQTGTGN